MEALQLQQTGKRGEISEKETKVMNKESGNGVFIENKVKVAEKCRSLCIYEGLAQEKC